MSTLKYDLGCVLNAGGVAEMVDALAAFLIRDGGVYVSTVGLDDYPDIHTTEISLTVVELPAEAGEAAQKEMGDAD